jgi:hypothetical protein
MVCSSLCCHPAVRGWFLVAFYVTGRIVANPTLQRTNAGQRGNCAKGVKPAKMTKRPAALLLLFSLENRVQVFSQILQITLVMSQLGLYNSRGEQEQNLDFGLGSGVEAFCLSG